MVMVKICPKCGSTNVKSVYLLSPQESGKLEGKLFRQGYSSPENPDVFICKSCNYYGICPEVEADGVKDFRNELKKNKSLNKFKADEKKEIEETDKEWIFKNTLFKIVFIASLCGTIVFLSFGYIVYSIVSVVIFSIQMGMISYYRVWKRRFSKN